MTNELTRPLPTESYAKGASGWLTPLALGVIVVIAMLASLCIGVYPMPFAKVAQIVAALASPWPVPDPAPWSLKDQTVVQVVRLPRILVATFSGVGLGISGAALQGMLRNPLVSPDLVGVASGAACGCILGILFDFHSLGILGLGLAGGLLALTLTSTLAKLVRGGTLAVVLAGVFVGAFFTALTGIFEYVSDSHTQLPSMVYWLLGSFVGADPKKVATVAIPTLGAGSILMLLRWRLNLLSLGDLDALSLGFNANRLRWTIIFLVSLIVAGQVASSGMIGWVGLVMPHLARMLVGPDHRRLLPVAALLGGLFTLILDDVSRTMFSQEIPVGLLSAMIGTPLICFLFWKTQSKGWIND